MMGIIGKAILNIVLGPFLIFAFDTGITIAGYVTIIGGF